MMEDGAGESSSLNENEERAADASQKEFADTLSHKGAMALAKRLQDYWHAQGYPAVRFWTEPVGERFSKVGTYELYRVVCNLVNGKPPRYLDHAAPGSLTKR